MLSIGLVQLSLFDENLTSVAGLDDTTSELMHDLDRICLQPQWLTPEVRLARLPQPTAAQREILPALEINLPEAICVPSKT